MKSEAFFEDPTMKSPSTLRPFHLICKLASLAALALGGLQVQAASIDYTGLVDSGPLAGGAFSGNFSYADPVAGYDGPVDLSSFTLNFNAHTYTLASGDAPALAWFAGGSFLGVDYVDQDSFDTAVQLTAGFTDIGEALFSYQPTGAAQGLGGFTSFTAAGVVPEPATLALLLAALTGWVATRRQQIR